MASHSRLDTDSNLFVGLGVIARLDTSFTNAHLPVMKYLIFWRRGIARLGLCAMT